VHEGILASLQVAFFPRGARLMEAGPARDRGTTNASHLAASVLISCGDS